MTIDDYIEDIDDPTTRGWVLLLHDIILSLVPQARPSIKFGVPFYDYHRWLCYWSVYDRRVELSFPYGYLLSNEQGLLTDAPAKGKGKQLSQVRKCIIQSLDDVQSESLQEVIAEAALLNEEAAKAGLKNYARGKKEGRK
jgi:hypothetical protein